MSIQATFQQAFEHHRHGRLHEAETLYRQVLQAAPQHADALHLLGVLALQAGQAAAAAELIAQAVALAPTSLRCSDLGNALHALSRRGEAIASYRQALALQDDLAEAHCNLANALLEEGEVDAAVASGRRAVALKPTLADAQGNLGNALLQQGRPDEAVACYAQALQLRPGMAVVHGNLGDALAQLGRDDEAIAHYGQALQAGLQTPELLCRLARVLKRAGRPEHAIACTLQAVALAERPELPAPTRAQARAAFVHTLHDLQFSVPQPELRACVQRALDEGWAQPAELLTPALSLVECEPALQQAVAWARQAGPGDRMAPALHDAVARDTLLRSLLEREPIASVALERLLTQLRRQALEDAVAAAERVPRADPPAAAEDFAVALARQCFLNDHVWVCSDAETQLLARLQAQVDADVARGTAPPGLALAVLACYAPLSAQPAAETWPAQTWPGPLAALLQQQVTEPALERQLAAAMPQLTAIDDAVSRLVQEQYETHPYPRWLPLASAAEPTDLATRLRRECPAAPTDAETAGAIESAIDSGPPDVLVAGCGTGQHPVALAQQLRGARILAVDLSRASLAYAQRVSQDLGLTQIRYAQADLLALGTLDQRFDLIESAGVLHHLADPLAGWQVLAGLLKPGGLMKIALYSELGRREVVAARQQALATRTARGERGLPTTAAEIRASRQAVMDEALVDEALVDEALVDEAPMDKALAGRFEAVLRSRDFYSTSACRDLLFHVQEHRFTVPQLQACLERLGLQFLGFAVDADTAAAYRRQWPDDPARTDLGHWHDFETARPDTFLRMYQFWVRKPRTPR